MSRVDLNTSYAKLRPGAAVERVMVELTMVMVLDYRHVIAVDKVVCVQPDYVHGAILLSLEPGSCWLVSTRN